MENAAATAESRQRISVAREKIAQNNYDKALRDLQIAKKVAFANDGDVHVDEHENLSGDIKHHKETLDLA